MNLRNFWRDVTSAILTTFLLTVIAQPMMAQSQPISGTVIDASGASIPDASVKIQDAVKGGPARQTNTDISGRFQAIDHGARPVYHLDSRRQDLRRLKSLSPWMSTPSWTWDRSG